MTKLQFRVLYREFLFRTVDLELISPQGDIGRLLGQFSALLVFFGMALGFAALGLESRRTPRSALMVSAWGVEHSLIAATMLVVGSFAVLSWDSTFPDRRDVLVLAPLPIRSRTLFLAKVAASATALGLTAVSLNALPGLIVPFALAPANGGILDVVLSLDFYRPLSAYWITMISAGAFVFCCVLGLQGIVSHLLPRGPFLRLSALLQMASFCLFLIVYFFEPTLVTPEALMAPENQRSLAWLPSYWFLGVFQQLNGSMHPALAPLAWRAWIGLAVSVGGTAVAYALSYFRTLKRIVEEPDIVSGTGGVNWLPPFGNSLRTAVVQFSIRTLSRSRQHRVMLAFFLGVGFALVIAVLKANARRQSASQIDGSMIFGSVALMFLMVVGTRVVFSMPLALRANWIFRVTQVRGAPEYLAAIRRALFVLAVVPVWAATAAVLFTIWPWRWVLQHLAVLALLGMIAAYICLAEFRKIPFTCSYLPGKSYVHMAILTAMGMLLFTSRGVVYEMQALDHPTRYAAMLAGLIVAAIVARWRAVSRANEEDAVVQFEELPDPALQVLGLNRDGVVRTSA